jgi:HEAT repeat protein
MPIPDEVVTLYSWHDGTMTYPGVPGLFPGAWFLSLADVVSTYGQRSAAARDAAVGTDLAPEELYDPRWLPLFVREHGMRVLVTGEDGNGGAIWYVSGEDPLEREREYHDLTDMVDTIASCYEDGTYLVDQSIQQVIEDLAAAAARKRKSDPAPAFSSGLIADLESDDWKLQSAALRTLKRYLYPEAAAGLVMLAQTAGAEVRCHAISLLADMGNTTLRPVITDSLDDKDERVRLAAEWGISYIDMLERLKRKLA